ncbi:MAG: hypothetical protein FD139_1038 [Methylocystaceae bacterium]|nr:MAG: hypothetical protein FD148_316 [Methylocystaceae bacterium]KAF0212865.1 MAG: hypothetical protein FD172_802 [Methylocystaceae bacterium]TXT46229.1 MAG: hypothetical protein FD139_1038 [Methylocystaceae bacterium]
MKKHKDPVLVGTWTFEAIQKFAGAATGGEAASMREAFKRQAESFRRNGDDGRAAFWEALSNRIADAADRSGRQAGEVLPTTDAT